MLKRGIIVRTIFDEYKIEAQINQGGNGTVFSVRNSAGQQLALKAIDREMTSTDKLKRFRNELAFCENDNHKNIIKIIDHGTYENENEKIIFYIMPLFPMTLREKMNQGVKHDEVLPLFYQLLDALKYAHQKKIWHRDIKPENILLDAQGKLILADFGIAHFCANDIVTAIETKKSDRLANFTYAAPEQRIKGAPIDGRADIFAAGLILNEMFTGRVIAGVKYETISAITSNYSYLDNIVGTMVSQNPEDRLYPVEKIAVHIASAQISEHDRLELIKLASKPSENNGEYLDISVPQVVGVDYKDNTLYLHLDGLDNYYSYVWFDVLKSGSYSRNSVMGYEPAHLRLQGNTLSISMRSENPQTVKIMAGNIRDWLVPATAIFNSNQRQELQRKRNEEEKKLQAEIKRLKIEEQIRMELKLSL